MLTEQRLEQNLALSSWHRKIWSERDIFRAVSKTKISRIALYYLFVGLPTRITTKIGLFCLPTFRKKQRYALILKSCRCIGCEARFLKITKHRRRCWIAMLTREMWVKSSFIVERQLVGCLEQQVHFDEHMWFQKL